jgi:hypothetical protein
MFEATKFLLGTGRGTIRRMVEGHKQDALSFRHLENGNAPLHQLRWSPSPFRGGFWGAALFLAALPLPALAQEMDHQQSMSGAYPEGCRQVDYGLQYDLPDESPPHGELISEWCTPVSGSGTSRLPAREGSHTGLHIMPGGDWMLMLHGFANGVYTKQSGPRGDDMFSPC